jgi:hypothetical protein
MRQPLSEYEDERDEAFGLVGEERSDEYAPRDRRLPAIALTMLAMAVFAGGLWFAYNQGARHAASSSTTSDGVPLIRADQRPTKIKPDQPGGMAIPDQNVSLYNEKPGVPKVEQLLPPPEKPMPRPVPPPTPPVSPPAAAAAPAPPPTDAGASTNVASVEPQVQPAAKPAGAAATQPKPPSEAKPAKPPVTATASGPVPSALAGHVQVRLGSLRSADEAREEWTRLKHDYPDLLGRLSAFAVRTDLGDKGIYYRIEAGPFADATAAEKVCDELKRRNHGCILAR